MFTSTIFALYTDGSTAETSPLTLSVIVTVLSTTVIFCNSGNVSVLFQQCIYDEPSPTGLHCCATADDGVSEAEEVHKPSL